MEISLLKTKLNIPLPRPQIIQRLRLIEHLQDSLKYNLILVSAPAGFGKTTLLSEWIRLSQPKVSAAWLSLDEDDNDPIRFWNYFVASLQTLQPAVGEVTQALLHSPEPLPIESLMTALINEIDSITFEFVVVLDDYHVITSQPIHDGITYLLEHLPSRMHLAIASRADPPLPLAHFRGKGTMLEIHTDDLRFTRDETAALLEKMKSPELMSADISALNQRTEGWAVGLKMAALSMRGQKDIPGFIAALTSSQRYIIDYLTEEVLLKQTAEIRNFLMKTSVLERLSAPLGDAITGKNDGQETLLKLERDHLFIVPLDESRQWYRYEHLFVDLLRHQCATVFDKKQVTELHRQASQWYEDNKFSDEAIHHALEAQDWKNAARLITAVNEQKRLNGEYVTVIKWIQRIPEEVIHNNFTLCSLYCGLLIAQGQLDAATDVIDHLSQAAEDNVKLHGRVNSLRSLIAFYHGDTELALELGNKALTSLPEDQLEMRTVVNTNLGFIQWEKGNFKEAEPFLSYAYETGKKIGHKYAAAGSLSLLASIDLARTGKLRQAVELFQQCIELAGPTPAAAPSHQVLAWISYEWNDLDAAVSQEQRAIDLGKLLGSQNFLARQCILLSQYKYAQGDESGALKAMVESCLIAHNSEISEVRAEHAAYHIQLALIQNKPDVAFYWGGKLAEDINALPYYNNHIPARLLIARGEMTAAAEKLQALGEEFTRGDTQTQMIKIRLYKVLSADNEELALDLLADILKMLESEGYIRTFVDEGKLLKPLLKKALSRGITPVYTRKILTIIEVEERQKRKKKKGESAPSPYQSILSEREFEILRLVAEGLSNQQIADRLIISRGTVKTHVHNIFEKLASQSRTQVIARAKELNLL